MLRPRPIYRKLGPPGVLGCLTITLVLSDVKVKYIKSLPLFMRRLAPILNWTYFQRVTATRETSLLRDVTVTEVANQ